MTNTPTIPFDRLQTAMRLLVRGVGSSAAEVEAVAGNLIEANLRGHDSHGIEDRKFNRIFFFPRPPARHPPSGPWVRQQPVEGRPQP